VIRGVYVEALDTDEGRPSVRSLQVVDAEPLGDGHALQRTGGAGGATEPIGLHPSAAKALASVAEVGGEAVRMKRQYYNVRTGAQSPRFTFEETRRLVHDAYVGMAEEFFQEAFGKDCPDGETYGTVGSNVRSFVLRHTRIDGVSNLAQGLLSSQDEVVLFTLIEFLDDLVSKGLKRGASRAHGYGYCGWHYEEFDKAAGQEEWRAQVRPVLANFGEGYAVTDQGEIQTLGPSGLCDIARAKLPAKTKADDIEKVEEAVRLFRHATSKRIDHVAAVRQLADVLERLRPQVKEHLLTADEAALFNIANNFAIRHHNDRQKPDYSNEWLAWFFYQYLSTIHLVLRLIERDRQNAKPPSPHGPPKKPVRSGK
jgi:hypothetical protein